MQVFPLLIAGLLLAGRLLVHSAWARPILSEPPLGTGSAAFSGGGAAHMTGPNAVFINPAALSVADGFQAEAGMMGLSSGFSPYFLYGASAGEHAAFALGYYYDARVDSAAGGPARQGMIAGGSWDLDPTASLGLTVRTQGIGMGRNGLGVDVDAGLLWRPRENLWAGLAVHDLEQSGVGQEPAGYETRRSYVAAAGLRAPAGDALGIRFRDPDAFYELRSAGLAVEDFVHAFSMASSFTPGGRLGLRGTFLLPDAGEPGFAFGVFLSFPAGKAGIVGGYVYDSGAGSGSGSGGGKAPSHSISLNFRMGGDHDLFPPMVEVRADKLVLVPDSTGDLEVFFRLTATDRTLVKDVAESDDRGGSGGWEQTSAEGGLRNYGRRFEEGRFRDWKLAVRAMGLGGQAGDPVKIYQGKDLPPKVIRWDGRDEAGNPVPMGFYAFRLSARDLAGNENFTVWQLLEIRSP